MFNNLRLKGVCGRAGQQPKQMANCPLSKMKRADVIQELYTVFDMQEPLNHNVQMLKSILVEQRRIRQMQSILKPPPMPSLKTEIIKALKEEGYDMTQLTGRENNGLLQRRLSVIRQTKMTNISEISDDGRQPSRTTKYIRWWERFAMHIQVYNRSRQSPAEIMNEDRTRIDREVIHDDNFTSPEARDPDPLLLQYVESYPVIASEAYNAGTSGQEISEADAPHRGVFISRMICTVRLYCARRRAAHEH